MVGIGHQLRTENSQRDIYRFTPLRQRSNLHRVSHPAVFFLFAPLCSSHVLYLYAPGSSQFSSRHPESAYNFRGAGSRIFVASSSAGQLPTPCRTMYERALNFTLLCVPPAGQVGTLENSSSHPELIIADHIGHILKTPPNLFFSVRSRFHNLSDLSSEVSPRKLPYFKYILIFDQHKRTDLRLVTR